MASFLRAGPWHDGSLPIASLVRSEWRWTSARHQDVNEQVLKHPGGHISGLVLSGQSCTVPTCEANTNQALHLGQEDVFFHFHQIPFRHVTHRVVKSQRSCPYIPVSVYLDLRHTVTVYVTPVY